MRVTKQRKIWIESLLKDIITDNFPNLRDLTIQVHEIDRSHHYFNSKWSSPRHYNKSFTNHTQR